MIVSVCRSGNINAAFFIPAKLDYPRDLSAGAAGAAELDGRLHAERLGGGVSGRRLHQRSYEELPDGAFILLEDEPWLVLGDALRRWSPGGYTERRTRPRGQATVITPPTTLGVLEAGWEGSVPLLHPSSGTAT